MAVYLYVLRSKIDEGRYIGISSNPEKRLREHNSRKVRSTKSRAPFALVYQEQYATLAEARAREKYFKTAAGRRWLDDRAF